MTLTDEDRAAIDAAILQEAHRNDASECWMTAKENAIYLAGLRAGMERAAKICATKCLDCADAIRAAAQEQSAVPTTKGTT